ncbi:MAG: HD domain-containing protein [Anaerolineales bacterium]|nr:HD domain-containing protein [Anaerolineales bacterium]
MLTSKPLTKLRRTFILYLIAMFVWSMCAVFIFAQVGSALIWFRVMVAAGLVSMLGLFYFTQALFAKSRRWTSQIFWFALVALSITLFSDLVVKSAYLENGFIVYSYHPLMGLVVLPGYSLAIFSLLELIRGYRTTHHDLQRTRLRYLIIAISLILSVSLVNWTELGKYSIDVAVNGVAALLIAYAILRHSLLDIRVFVRTGLLYSIFTGFVGAVFYLAISLTLTFYETYTGQQIVTLSVIVALITSLLFSPLREKTQDWIDRLFYRAKYDASLMLERLSETTATLMEVEDITGIIIHEITDTMKLEPSWFYIFYESIDSYQRVGRKGSSNWAFNEFKADHPIVEWLSNGNHILTKHQLTFDPVFKSLWSSERTSLISQKIELFIPLIAGKELVGFFTIGEKLSGLPFAQDDIRILITVANQTAMAVKNARLFNELQETFVQTVVTLANAIDIRDTYTSDHSQRIAALAVDTAEAMGCDPDSVQQTYWGSLLHDVGKIGIPDAILLKPGPLDDSEWDVIKTHPDIGANLIQPIKQLAHIAPIIKHSHEWYDGNGYPDGIRGDQIPLGARIVTVVDAFSAMMDKRVYKDANSLEETLEELRRFSGTQFDPQVVEVFLKVIETYDTRQYSRPSQPAFPQKT